MSMDDHLVPAGVWLRTDRQLPEAGIDVPILYRERKNSKPELHLACWCPESETTGPGWMDDGEGRFYREPRVSHWMQVQLPPEVK